MFAVSRTPLPSRISSVVRGLALASVVAFGWTAQAATAATTDAVFNVKVALSETVTFLLFQPCPAVGYLMASGTSDQLGAVKGTALDCINPIGPLSFNTLTSTSFHFVSTKVVLTTAAGDMLYLSYSGTLRAQASGPHAIDGYFVITGGTGRYVHAVGGGSMTGTEDLSSLSSGKGEATFAGHYSY